MFPSYSSCVARSIKPLLLSRPRVRELGVAMQIMVMYRKRQWRLRQSVKGTQQIPQGCQKSHASSLAPFQQLLAVKRREEPTSILCGSLTLRNQRVMKPHTPSQQGMCGVVYNSKAICGT